MPTCPYCAESIPARVRVCPICDSDLSESPRPRRSRARMEDDAAMRFILPVGRSGWAIAAGYLGLVSILLIPAPMAIICSILAILDMKKNPEKHGMGRAVFGLMAGIGGSILLVIVVVVLMSKPGF